MVRPAEFVYSSFLAAVAGTRIEFRGDDRSENRALEDPGVLAEPRIVLAPAEPNVYAGIEEKGASRKWCHRLFVGARSKGSSRPPRFRKRRRA
jgi:hypothetical protein